MQFDPQYIRELKEKAAAYSDVDAEALSRAYSELDDAVIIEAISRLGTLTVDPASGTDMKAMPVPEKIDKNNLGEKAQRIITNGLCHSRQIAAFIRNCTRTDPDFAKSLRTYVCDLYTSLHNEGFWEDDLLIAMKEHMEKVSGNLAHAAALTAIVVHMFLVCDIFKKSGEAGERALRRESGL